MTVVKLCLFFACYYVATIAGQPTKNLKLDLVQVIFRHGARTPVDCELKLVEPNQESLYKPWGYAHLTNEGMMQEYRLGLMLRNRYKNYLPDLYKMQDVFAYSSGFDRTKASLQLLLAALYPPKDGLVWNDDLNWMPIPIHSIPRELDILMKPRNCPRYIKLMQELYNTTAIKHALSEYSDILRSMQMIYGKYFQFNKFICAYNLILIQKNLNLTLPNWYSEERFEKISKATELHLDTLSYTPTLKRLNGGTLIKRFVENMKSSDRKIYLYSGHDTNIHAFAKSHNLDLEIYPDFGSAFMLEKLVDEQKKYYVRLLLWTGEPKTLTTMKLKNCGEICPMSDYLALVNPILPTDEEMRCLFQNLRPEDLEKILRTDYIASESV